MQYNQLRPFVQEAFGLNVTAPEVSRNESVSFFIKRIVSFVLFEILMPNHF